MRGIFVFFSLVVFITPSKVQTQVGTCGVSNVMSIGPCTSGVAGPCSDGAGVKPGYACDATLTQCCPYVNTDLDNVVGPAVGGMCPSGYTVVYGLPIDTFGNGVCVALN